MKIAMVVPFEESVPPHKYGGTEIVAYNLITELVARGHDVTLFGTGDANVPCRVVPIFPTSIRTTEPYASDQALREKAKYLGISKMLDLLQQESFDIVHNHIGWRFCSFAHLVKQPMVTTLHGPPGTTYDQLVSTMFPELSFVSISDNQRKSMPNLRYVRTVYNGIDLSLYPFAVDREDEYLFFLARFSPEKGPKEAIEIAKRTGKKLKMAVKVDQVDREFFEQCKPELEAAHVELIGEIELAQKVDLLQHASALLAPIQWEEPFGLFIVEAMACGTPVIGTNRGSFPEIVTHGVDGFLGSSVDELSSYVAKLSSIDRNACRRKVETMFSKTTMAEGYLKAYEEVLASA